MYFGTVSSLRGPFRQHSPPNFETTGPSFGLTPTALQYQFAGTSIGKAMSLENCTGKKRNSLTNIPHGFIPAKQKGRAVSGISARMQIFPFRGGQIKNQLRILQTSMFTARVMQRSSGRNLQSPWGGPVYRPGPGGTAIWAV